MKKTISILLLLCIMHNYLFAQFDANKLDFYKKYSIYTNPGKYEEMYSNLPDSLSQITEIIKAQLIHPMADLPRYRDLIPAERSWEDLKYPSVETMLAGLKGYNPSGLVLDRKPVDRLVVSCRFHAILFASIMKFKGIPTRVRYGFAPYLYPGNHIYHVICEVWNSKEKRWMLVDPDRQLIDFPAEQWEFSCDVWEKYQQGKLDPATYGIPTWWGAHPILDVMCHDLASVLGNEEVYLDRPAISADSTMNVKNMHVEELNLANKVSSLLKNVDGNFKELQKIYNKNPKLQFPDKLSMKN